MEQCHQPEAHLLHHSELQPLLRQAEQRGEEDQQQGQRQRILLKPNSPCDATCNTLKKRITGDIPIFAFLYVLTKNANVYSQKRLLRCAYPCHGKYPLRPLYSNKSCITFHAIAFARVTIPPHTCHDPAPYACRLWLIEPSKKCGLWLIEPSKKCRPWLIEPSKKCGLWLIEPSKKCGLLLIRPSKKCIFACR